MAHRRRLGRGECAAHGGALRHVGIDEIARRKLHDDEGHHGDRPHGDHRQTQPPGEIGEHQALQYQVSGCELPGVRQCCARHTRAAMLPSLLLTTRTPMPAGDWPTVPMPIC